MEDLPTSQDDPRLDGWYHTVELGDGLVSKGMFDHRSVVDCYGLPASLKGKTVLDVATANGFFAFEMERRGAESVLAVDVPSIGECDWMPRIRTRLRDSANVRAWSAQFRLAHAMRGSRVEYRAVSVYDLSPYTVGTFDVVFCGSLLLHLQHPLGALAALRSVTNEMLVIETAVDPAFEEVPDKPLMSFGYPGEEAEPGERNSYWMFSTCALRKMLRYADFPVAEPQGVFLLPPSGPWVSSVVAYPGPSPQRWTGEL
ncbi:MAG: methyltransferase domain-containing protein [Actinomycetota bacterium]|nr:methyltransferase domain-containing protein [Actinomycetota bacterium]